jgi:hypothetical protein
MSPRAGTKTPGPQPFPATAEGPAVAVRKPMVRHFIPCERIEVSGGGKHVSLHNLIQSISLTPGGAFPQVQPQVSLYVVMTDGTGKQSFEVELVGWDDQGEEESLYRTPTIVVELGTDPLAVRGWPINLRNITFPHAGRFEFRLWCGGELLAQESILWKEAP